MSLDHTLLHMPWIVLTPHNVRQGCSSAYYDTFLSMQTPSYGGRPSLEDSRCQAADSISLHAAPAPHLTATNLPA